MRKISNVLRAASCCTFSLLMCLPAAGQDAWSQADCVTLLDSTAVTVQPNGSGSFAVYRSFRVQTPKGAVNNHVIKYDYDPLTAFARFKQVTLQRANGETVQVDVTKTCDYAAPARAIYWGARQIMIELGSLEPGDTVSYEISKKGFTYALLAGGEDDDARFIPPMRGQFYDIVPFWVNQPTRRKVYTVSMPMEKELQFQFYNGACASSMRYEDGRKVYTFAKNEVLPFGREPNMVDLFDEAPKLMMSSTPRWEDKSLWFHDLNEAYGSFDALPEAQQKVKEQVRLPEGYTLKWTGDFENQQRATKRLAQVVPVSIAIIFIILFVLFGNARDAGLVLLNVPYAAVGGILALLLTRFNFSISAGIGFIALFGICIQNGVIMISDIKSNLKARSPLDQAIKQSVRSRVRSVLMTASMAAIGLMPAALSHGIGSESQRPLAIVIIGGLIGATFFTLFVFPLMVETFYRRMLYDKDGKLLQRKL